MKNKKLVCLLMAVLILVLAMPAFAAEGTLEVEPSAQAGTNLSMMALQETVVDVSVPAAGKLYINPLGFPVHYEYEGKDVTDTSQILTEPTYIKNEGEDPVRVSVSVTGTVQGGEMLLSSSSTKASATTSKRAFIYFEIQAVSDPNKVTWDEAYDSAKHVYVHATYTKSKKGIVDLDGTGGADCYGAFRLTGDCVAEPKKPWTAADGMKVVVAFTFQPIVTVS